MRSRIIFEVISEALKSNMNQKIGAIAVRGNRIIARGHNSDAAIKIGYQRKRQHAECQMIANLNIYLDKKGIFGYKRLIFQKVS